MGVSRGFIDCVLDSVADLGRHLTCVSCHPERLEQLDSNSAGEAKPKLPFADNTSRSLDGHWDERHSRSLSKVKGAAPKAEKPVNVRRTSALRENDNVAAPTKPGLRLEKRVRPGLPALGGGSDVATEAQMKAHHWQRKHVGPDEKLGERQEGQQQRDVCNRLVIGTENDGSG